MARPIHPLFVPLGLAALAAGLVLAPPATAAGRTAADPSAPRPVDLQSYRNNDGVGSAPGQANIDGSRYSFPAGELPAAGPVKVGGVPFTWPGADGDDNVAAVGQTISVPQGRYHVAYVLATSTYGESGGNATVNYTDGTTSQAPLSAPDWYSGGTAQVNSPYRYSPTGKDEHPVGVYLSAVAIDPAREVKTITLPTTASPAEGRSSLHVFAISLQPVVPGVALRILDARSTTNRLPGRDGAQVVTATVQNIGSDWAQSAKVTVESGKASTVKAARIDRLAPGEQARVQIGIQNAPGVPAGTKDGGTVTVTAQSQSSSLDVPLSLGIPPYTADDASLGQHEAPGWFNDAKFGIFIHWGIYSVPAWAPVGKEYAEWYWQHLDNKDGPTYAYHREKYGENFNYDDFIPQFKAEKFDPKSWVKLFDQAGAKYFVLTSKHHEGFSLYDTKYSDRNSVKLGPHQDLVKKLFDASRKYTPDMRPGLYYSIPEWYNPAMPWMGHGPQNPYTGQAVPYVGDKPVKDFVNDLQVPQMKELINNYGPDVIWCDIGWPATNRSVLSDYFNHAAQQNKEVTVDNRCGLPTFDYTTPEYATYHHTVVQKWEASRGLDPFSYGYNSATPDDKYMTTEQVVHTLADIVSKNGNFLLDIGPRADGTIPEIMQTRLRETGAWLKDNGESIYGTTYWWRAPEEGDLRFTLAPNKAFYITSLARPGDQVTVNSPVPIRDGQKVKLLGYHGAPLKWSKQNGRLVIDVPKAAQQSGAYAWVFKIS